MAEASPPQNPDEPTRESRRAEKRENRYSTWQGWLLLVLMRVLGVLPLSVNRALGAAVGRLSYARNSLGTRITRVNHELCFPSLPAGERERRVKDSMRETGRVGTELPLIWTKSHAWLKPRLLDIQGQTLLEKHIADDCGVIVLLPHLGNWEVFGPYLSNLTTLTAMYQPPKQPAMESLIRAARERWGATLVPTNRRGVMGLFKTLKNGGTTVILPDQVPDRGAGAELAPFYGVPASTMTLVHNLMSRTGCRILMGYALRVPGGFSVVIEEPDPDIYNADSEISLAGLNRSVEACVNACPSQYQWEYKRFKRSTVKGGKPYPKG